MLIFQTAKAVPSNNFGGVEVAQKTLYQQWLAQTETYRNSNVTSGTIGPDHLLTVLGTGSDFGGFCHHLGVVSANVGFSLSGSYGTYHSTMDSIIYWNDKLMYLERHLTLESGLPHRGWYKHVVFGPGFYDGYGGTAFPGLADGIAFHDSAEAIQAHVDEVVKVLDGAAAFLLSK